MEIETRNHLNKLIRKLEDGEIDDFKEPENILFEILSPLLSADGYEFQRNSSKEQHEIDFLAKKTKAEYNPSKLAIEFKYYHRASNISSNSIEQFLRPRKIESFDRLLLISNVGLTHKAVQLLERNNPLDIQFFNMDDLRAWIGRQELNTSFESLSVESMLRVLSRAFAKKIAEDPNTLTKLEWRDTERLLAEIFDGIGFNVTLTPGAQDGGKDLVLECYVNGANTTFIVEIKHWRSGQKVGQKSVSDFIRVIVNEKRDGGLFLSTYGFGNTAYEALSQIDQHILKFGDQEKIVALCKTYLKIESGIWSTKSSLPEILYEKTL